MAERKKKTKTKTTQRQNASQKQSVRQTVIIRTEAPRRRSTTRRKRAEPSGTPATTQEAKSDPMDTFMAPYSRLLNSINTIYDQANMKAKQKELESQMWVLEQKTKGFQIPERASPSGTTTSRKTTGTSYATGSEGPAASDDPGVVPLEDSQGTTNYQPPSYIQPGRVSLHDYARSRAPGSSMPPLNLRQATQKPQTPSAEDLISDLSYENRLSIANTYGGTNWTSASSVRGAGGVKKVIEAIRKRDPSQLSSASFLKLLQSMGKKKR
jgi:hypothetical protein